MCRISQTTFSIQKGVDRLNETQNDLLRLRVLDWLTKLDYNSRQSDLISRRQPGTGEWLLQSDKYQTWLNGEAQTLYCRGIPGSGKTTLVSILIDQLCTQHRGNPSIGIAYIYLNFRGKDDQNINDLVACIMKQLVYRRPTLATSVKDLHDAWSSEGGRPSFDHIYRALESVTKSFTKVYILVDALDECQDSDRCRTRLLDTLSQLQVDTKVNLLLTSRGRPDIDKYFQKDDTLSIEAHEDDVRRYLESNMWKLSSCVAKRADLQKTIIEEIIKAAEGM